jgi:hypothetical protein
MPDQKNSLSCHFDAPREPASVATPVVSHWT